MTVIRLVIGKDGIRGRILSTARTVFRKRETKNPKPLFALSRLKGWAFEALETAENFVLIAIDEIF